MAVPEGLPNGDAAIDVAQGLVLLLSVPAHKVVLPDIVQGQLFLTELYYDGVGDNLHCKIPHCFLEGCGEKQHLAAPSQHWYSPLNANALVREALMVNHYVSFIQHKQADSLHIHHSPFETPVQHCSRSPDDNLLLPQGACVRNPDVGTKLPHLLDHMSDLQGQLVGWSQAEAL
uniref:Uncharacterized protein n=1 Tax=Anas platyrhynchos TaxID=8839 RepID=A0A8B9T510_ANAPL